MPPSINSRTVCELTRLYRNLTPAAFPCVTLQMDRITLWSHRQLENLMRGVKTAALCLHPAFSLCPVVQTDAWMLN